MLAFEIGRLGHTFAYLGRASACVDLNRNEIMAAAKDIGADYLLMLDTDIDLPVRMNVIEHLLSLNKDIVSGVIHQGSYPFRPMVYYFGGHGITNYVSYPAELFKADATGGGFLFISKKVIEHFKHDVSGECPFDYMYSPLFLREDVAFCYRAKQAGFELWVEPRIQITHWKRLPIGAEYWELTKNQLQQREKEKAGQIDGFMSEEEMMFLREKSMLMESVAEIGSWKGRSTKVLLDNCKGQVTVVDHWQGSDTIRGIASETDIHAEFIKNVGHYPNLKIMKMPSLEAAASLNGDKFDMVFIDASHDYGNVKSDIEAWLPRTNKLICGHDYSDGWPGVKRAVSEKFPNFNLTGSIWWVEL